MIAGSIIVCIVGVLAANEFLDLHARDPWTAVAFAYTAFFCALVFTRRKGNK